MKRPWIWVQVGLCLSGVVFGGCSSIATVRVDDLPELGERTSAHPKAWPELPTSGGGRAQAKGPIKSVWVEHDGRYTRVEPSFHARIDGDKLEVADEHGVKTFRVPDIASVQVETLDVKTRREITGGFLVAGSAPLFLGAGLAYAGIASRGADYGADSGVLALALIGTAGGLGMAIPGLSLLLSNPQSPERSDSSASIKPRLEILPGGAKVSVSF